MSARRGGSGIRIGPSRHEQGASHMADGYARATGKAGVCFATSGPGATNLVTGLATANMDSIPVVAITGQVRTDSIGSDAFQEADITGISRPITKHNYLVKDIRDLPRGMQEAFYIATSGRPGPGDGQAAGLLAEFQEDPYRYRSGQYFQDGPCALSGGGRSQERPGRARRGHPEARPQRLGQGNHGDGQAESLGIQAGQCFKTAV